MSGVSLEDARERVRLVRAALSEEGFTGRVRIPSESKRERGVACVSVDVNLPVDRIRKATYLAQLKQRGPDHLTVCENHRPHVNEWERCPKYPVGALLAGAIEGCAR